MDLSNIPFVSPAMLLPTIHYARSNSILTLHCHNNAIGHINKILGKSNGNSNMIPLNVIKLKNYDDEVKTNIITSIDQKIRKLLFPHNKRGHVEYGGVGVFPYITGEIFSNVEQHSNANTVYTYSQIYPNEGYIDVAILDDGISIPGKYEQSRPEFINNDINPYEFKNDCEAIFRSLNGISTKEGFKKSMNGLASEEDIVRNDNIGYGINTSIRTITEGLGGSFLIASRKGICHLTPNMKKKFIKVKDNNILNGTLICIRFKKIQLEQNEFEGYIEKHIPIQIEDAKW
ncbi:hypothetical protein [Methanobacterium spitsbergense]|uniref:Uncharacterized protein n=1 Tax=Methanobacterium spitsbergense TaxID=2874285 RepID=A0A8T5UXL0_9EURY|nr:hypothetical protein [Methanobacterium spitsbergense]MBZ2167037.1 hypothetical protein [Methanobacterium spitsbergense]